MTTISRSGRRMTTVEVVAPLGSRLAFVRGQFAVAAAYLALFVCAAVPTSVGFLLAIAAITAAELIELRPGRFPAWALSRIGLGPIGRGLLRGVAFVLFAARTSSAAATVLTAAAVTAVAGLRALHVAANRVVAHLRKPPAASRHLDLQLPPVPAAPPRWTTTLYATSPSADLVAGVALFVAARGGSTAWPSAAWALAAMITVVPVALLTVHAARLWRLDVRNRLTAAVTRRVAELQPEIVAYLGNGAEWRYQLEMWLSTLEAMPHRILLVVRDHEVLDRLAPTSLPVVSIPGGTLLMTTPLPGLRAALYVGNTANNLHLLRRPGIRNVFIGHGDSDKGASANPFARVYHEIWVAGPAGRDRYAAAGVDLPASAFVEVGRPQLRELPRRPEPEPRLTVLYAPTWEGWGEDEFHSSLPHAGPGIVAALLARGDVRVMYRPHPRTGHRDPATRRAHLEILRLLREAGALPPGELGLPPRPAQSSGVRGRDLLDRVLAPAPGGWTREAHAAELDAWADAFWAAQPGHRILVAPCPDLHDCFEMADALIADISSVPTDFLATNRPYAIVNCSGAPEAEFRARSATARGGFVLAPDLRDLDELVRAAGGSPDPTAVGRKEARDYLLGPRTADPAARFREELDRLCR